MKPQPVAALANRLGPAAEVTWAALSQQHLSSTRAETFISPHLSLRRSSQRKRWQSASQSTNSFAVLSAYNYALSLWVTALEVFFSPALSHNHHVVKNLGPPLICVLWNGKAHLTACGQNRNLMFQTLGFFFSPSLQPRFSFFSFFNRICGCHSDIIIQQFIRRINHLFPLRCRHETLPPSASFTLRLMCGIVENLQWNTSRDELHAPPHTHTHWKLLKLFKWCSWQDG